MQPLVLVLTAPEHKPGQPPNHVAVGKRLDNLLKKHFFGKEVVIRCIGSQDHPSLTLDRLTDIVVDTGTDKYDISRMGVGYEEFVRKGIKVDFYGEDEKITADTAIMSEQVREMYHSAIGDRGFGVHVDLVLIYDASHLDMVMNLYDHHPTSDGFTFKDPSNRRASLLGVIKVLS